MSQATLAAIVNRISNNGMAILARTTNQGLTRDNAEACLAIARKMRRDNDELGALLERAANIGPAPGSAADDSHATNNTAPLATIGGGA